MKKTLRAILLALLATAAARAEDRSPISVGLFGLTAVPLSPSEITDGYEMGSAYGARLRHEVNDRWTLGGQFANHSFRSKADGQRSVTLQSVVFVAQRRFFDSRTWMPFANATLGISRNRRDYFSNVRINNGLTAGLGVGTQWNFADLAALSFELSLRHVDKASPSGKAAKIADAGILVSFYLPEGWVPLIPKEELSLEDLETPLDSAPGQVDEALQMQGEINRVLQQIEDGQTPPVTFEAGNSIMLTTSYEALDNIGAILRRHPEMKVRVYGFVEEEFVGGVVRGETLALARAEAVRTYLNQNFRLPEGTLISAGLPPLPAVLDGQEPPPPARHISFEVLP
ncbi:MAG TPA: outer membrane beta-barrel protein [Elusimicrobiota bacterium]|nr:outer membrane beta-barrel protein [Elusimicrobiota bacterium]